MKRNLNNLIVIEKKMIMKQLKLKSFMLGMMLLVTASVSAYDFTVDGKYYNIIDLQGSTCEITHGDETYTGDIVIPEYVEYDGNTLTVVSIGERAFAECFDLSNVIIPNSVTEIGDSAFSRTSLDSIEIPNSVMVIGEDAFSGSSLRSIDIPNSVTEIGMDAFSNCRYLTSVVIGNSLKEMSVAMFMDCDSLTSVVIGNSVTVIGELAFGNCTSLTNISIPNSVKEIGYDAFCNCTGLTSVEIGNSVTLIDNRTFYGCSSLTNMAIPNSVEFIGHGAFDGCTSLKNLVIEDGSETLGVGHNEDICSGLFKDCPIETLYLGRNLDYETGEEYGYSPFYDVTTLTDVTIGSMVTDVKSLYWRRYVDNLKTLQLQCATPPTVNDEGFDDYQYANLNVYVPEGSLDAYKADDVWKNFLNLWEGDPTGISGVEALGGQGVKVDNGNIVVDNATGRVSVYDAAGTLVKSVMPDGNRVEIAVPSRGVYIVRAGGKAVKVAL